MKEQFMVLNCLLRRNLEGSLKNQRSSKNENWKTEPKVVPKYNLEKFLVQTKNFIAVQFSRSSEKEAFIEPSDIFNEIWRRAKMFFIEPKWF